MGVVPPVAGHNQLKVTEPNKIPELPSIPARCRGSKWPMLNAAVSARAIAPAPAQAATQVRVSRIIRLPLGIEMSNWIHFGETT